MQVNWLSNNGLPGLEPRGLLPACILKRVPHEGSVSSELNWHMTVGTWLCIMEPGSPCIPNLLGILGGGHLLLLRKEKASFSTTASGEKWILGWMRKSWRFLLEGWKDVVKTPSNIEPKVIQCFEGVEDGMEFFGIFMGEIPGHQRRWVLKISVSWHWTTKGTKSCSESQSLQQWVEKWIVSLCFFLFFNDKDVSENCGTPNHPF